MTGFYSKMRGVADSLLGPQSPFAQGQMLLRRTSPGSGPPHDPGPPVTTDYPLSGTVRGVSAQHVDGSLVVMGDKIATVAVPAVEPVTSDRVLIDGRPHSIVKIERKPEAGPAVAYLLFLRI